MQLIPDQLWIPSQKDALGQFAPVSVQRLASTGAMATTVQATLPVSIPFDQILLVGGYFSGAVGGGGQVCTTHIIQVVEAGVVVMGIDSNANDIALAGGSLVNSAIVRHGLFLPLLQGQQIRATGIFDAGVASNTCNISLYGVLIPRGNWQRG